MFLLNWTVDGGRDVIESSASNETDPRVHHNGVRKQPPIVENIELENKFHEPAMQEVILAEVGKALESILPNIYSQMKREVRGMVVVEVDVTMTAREVNRQQENMVLIVSNYRIVLLRISLPARLLRRSQTCG
ncbi:hypothetical protein Tco_0117476 [Tanacetum coccineum]